MSTTAVIVCYAVLAVVVFYCGRMAVQVWRQQSAFKRRLDRHEQRMRDRTWN